MSHQTLKLAAASVIALTLAGQAAAAAASGGVDEVVVTAKRLDMARQTIEPNLGASAYSMPAQFIDSLAGGANTSLNQVVLQAPGVAQDSFGQLHIRGDHGNVQYRLNGVILPEGLSLFGQTLSPRLAGDVQLITGALPAQYGLRTAGVIAINTKTGLKTGGQVGIYGGSDGTYQPSVEVGGSSGGSNVFMSADFKRSQRGIESPTGDQDPVHDRTDQAHAFFYGDHILDESSRVSLIAGASDARFQIPNSAGLQPDLGLTVNGRSAYPSASLNETQREATEFAAASYLRSQGPLTMQASLFARYSTLTFKPDLVGDLLYNGIAQQASKTDIAGGLQAEGAYVLNDAHTLRAGVIAQTGRTRSHTTSQVLLVDAQGNPGDQPVTLLDSSRRTTNTYSAFLQDEWKLAPQLVLNYGLRFDASRVFVSEQALSPRINLVWTPIEGLSVHGGYARYFTPPPGELVADQTIALFSGTTAASPGTLNATPRAEKSDYLDLGAEMHFSGRVAGLTLGIDSYAKQVRNLLDEGQFGAPIILTPFNYKDGRVHGVELTGAYDRGSFTSYVNLAYSKAQGRGIVSSQFNFDPADLAYIAAHYIPLDHDQTYTASAGAAYKLAGTRVAADLLYGSGLRADGATPNGRQLAGYTQVNLALSHSFTGTPVLGGVEVRFDVINLFDKVYEIRDGSGVGVGAPQFGPRRGYFAGVSKAF
jgi:outer membrane receptor protein involved in Fe transport